MTREEVRAALPAEMVRQMDALVAKFGAKPAFIECEAFTLGDDLETDAGWRKYRTKRSIQKFMESQSA